MDGFNFVWTKITQMTVGPSVPTKLPLNVQRSTKNAGSGSTRDVAGGVLYIGNALHVTLNWHYYGITEHLYTRYVALAPG